MKMKLEQRAPSARDLPAQRRWRERRGFLRRVRRRTRVPSERLFVRARTRRRPAESALGRDQDVDVPTLQFDGGSQVAATLRRTKAAHRCTGTNKPRIALLGRSLVHEAGYRNVGQSIELVWGPLHSRGVPAVGG